MTNNQLSADNLYYEPFGMDKYFRNRITPSDLLGQKLSVTMPTPRTQVENILLLFVYDGEGKITINHMQFNISRGALICLGPFHNYTITPAPGSTVKAYSCIINCDLYLYILACPYVKAKELFIPQAPTIAYISEADSQRAERLLETILLRENTDYFDTKFKFLYVIELMGILINKLEPPYRNLSNRTSLKQP